MSKGKKLKPEEKVEIVRRWQAEGISIQAVSRRLSHDSEMDHTVRGGRDRRIFAAGAKLGISAGDEKASGSGISCRKRQ